MPIADEQSLASSIRYIKGGGCVADDTLLCMRVPNTQPVHTKRRAQAGSSAIAVSIFTSLDEPNRVALHSLGTELVCYRLGATHNSHAERIELLFTAQD